ncbi:MAG TPA: ABC transporter permease [Candidatus Angelobacter sp.]|nr:ABC transporter permease [Candidatus Angelobacter sp.]
MLQEIRHAFRLIARSPGFTFIAVLSLALGIGANAAVFSLADALLFRPLPVAHPGSVMALNLDTPSGDPGNFSYPDYRDLRATTKSFDGLVAFQLSTFSLARTNDEVPQMRAGFEVSDNFFSALGIEPMLGRSFLPEETVKGGSPAVVLCYGFWQDQFNADKGVLGRTVRLSGTDFTIVGVTPKTFTGMDQYVRPSFIVPAAMTQQLTGAAKDPLENRNEYGFTLEGRLRKGASISQAQAEMSTLWKGLQQQYPADSRNGKMAVRTQIQYRIAQDSVDAILVTMLMALVSIVLLIACANVANLLLGRARGRSREFAVRIALGVSRIRLMRQLFAENIVLSLLGGLFGLVFAYGGIRFLQTIQVPSDLPIVIAPELDQRVLIFSLIASLCSVLVFGLAPAFQSLKTELVSALKSAESNMAGRRRTLGRNTLVIAQIALSMVLLIASGMLFEGFQKSLAAGPGFRTDHLLITEFDTSLVHYTPEKSRDFYRNLVDRALALPGVRATTLTAQIPFGNQQIDRIVIPEGYQPPKGQANPDLLYNVVDEHYFDIMKIGILSGRGFTADDKAGSAPVAIVNQEFAARFWPGQDPLGKRIRLDNDKGTSVQVIGVARNSKYTYMGEPQYRYFYLPYAQEPKQRMILLTESSGDPAQLATPLREIVRTMDRNQPMYNVRTLGNFFELRAVAPLRIVMQMVVTMGLMGLVLALIGIYGLVSYSVARRTREIGVRIAIGANRADVIKMVLRQGFVLACTGIAIGGALSLVAGKALAAGMIGLGKVNPVAFVLVPIAVLLVTMAACWAPAWRASRVDPLRALRAE